MNVSLFKNKNFLLYWLAGWITSLGDAVFVIALTWMLVEATGSPVIVGTYLFVFGIAKLIFVLLGGVVVDRFNQKKLLIYSDVIRAGIMIFFFVIQLSGLPPLWLFYLVGIIFGVVDAVSEPAQISCRTRIVDKQFYTQSMSLLMIAGNVSAILGPAIGALLVRLGGADFAILINGISFLLSAGLLLLVKFKTVNNEVQTSTSVKAIVADFKEGMHYFFKTPIILTMATFALFANAAVGATVVSIPFLSKDLGAGVEGFGLMNTGIGIGSAVGAILFSLFVIRNPVPWMTLLTCFVQGVMIFLVGYSGNLWLVVFLLAGMGLLETAVNVIAPSVNHVIIPERLFGRVISVMILVMSGSIPFSQAIAGWVMEVSSPQTVFIYGGVLEMLAAAATFCLPFVRLYGKKSNHDKITA